MELRARSPRVLFANFAWLAGVAMVSAIQASAALLPYPTLPTAVASPTYRVSVDGQAVYVEKFGDVSFARFAFIGSVGVTVAIDAAITGSSLSPVSYRIESTIDGNTLRFTLAQPRNLVIRLNNLERLILCADAPEGGAPAPGDFRVVDFGTYLSAGRDPNAEVTSILQRAIDDVAAQGGGAGGTLYVPDGLYYSAQFKLKSNVRLHLSSGAVIRALNNFSTGKYPRQNSTDSSFVYIDSANNVSITGRGVLDGNGWALRHSNDSVQGDGVSDGGNCKLIRSRATTNLTIEDVYLRDSARFTIHPLYSDHVTIRRVKIMNDLRLDDGGTTAYVSNTDGIDPDACSDVLVDDCFIYTEDDALSPKVTGYMGLEKTATGLTFSDNVIWTHKCAIKVGDELLGDIDGVIFAGNDVIFADRLVALWAGTTTTGGGNTIRNFTALDNRTEKIGYLDNKCFYYFRIVNPAAQLTDVTVNGVYALAAAAEDSRIDGYDAAHYVTHVTFTNLYEGGNPVSSLAGIPLRFVDNYYNTIALVPPGGSAREVRTGTPSVSSQTVPVTPELPLVSIRAADSWGREGDDSIAFTLSRLGSLANALTVQLAAGGSAAAGIDYDAPPAAVTFAAGIQQVTVTLRPRADTIEEGDETVTLSVESGPGYATGTPGLPASATATIADVPPLALTAPTIDAAGAVTTTFRRPRDGFGDSYVVESSTDLTEWDDAAVTLRLLSTADDLQTWQASAPRSDRRFFRLRRTIP